MERTGVFVQALGTVIQMDEASLILFLPVPLNKKGKENMYVYIQSELSLWTVGFYDPKGAWHPESDHDNREEAVRRVHYLNGGK